MRQILIDIPSKLLFFLALTLAGASFLRDVLRRARTRSSKKPAEFSSLPLYFLAAAWALVGLRGPGFVPEAAAFAQPWKSLPIYAYVHTGDHALFLSQLAVRCVHHWARRS